MAYRRTPFAPEEWYHIYTQGIDKRNIFLDKSDFKRFQALLYLANSSEPIDFEIIRAKKLTHEDLFAVLRPKTLVSIGAYCLMKNHPHIIVQEKNDGGITSFMRKLGTAYTMYFNRKHGRIGNLMVKPFRSKHIEDDRYLRRVVQYVHLNPAETFEHGWKKGKVRNMPMLEKRLLGYRFSSLPDYFGGRRPERNIIDGEAYNLFADDLPKLNEVLGEAIVYYAEIESEFSSVITGRMEGDTFLLERKTRYKVDEDGENLVE